MRGNNTCRHVMGTRDGRTFYGNGISRGGIQDVVPALSSSNVQITGNAVHPAAGMDYGILHADPAAGNSIYGRGPDPQFLIHGYGALYGSDA